MSTASTARFEGLLRLVHDGPVAEIHLDRPPANALNTELIAALDAALVSCHGAGAIVLTGRPGMFSGGLDVPLLLPWDRAAIHEFWRAFFTVNRRLVTSPVPVVAAISGHSPAGGAVLAIHCDYRLAARGNFRIGLNEVAVGLPIPPSILTALRETVGARWAHRLASTADLLPVDKALECGLVDELAEPEALLGRAREVATRLAGLPRIALCRTRERSRSELLRVLDPEAEAELATEYWFSAETQAGMRALVERLNRKQ